MLLVQLKMLSIPICRSELMKWAEEDGNWDKIVRPMIVDTIAWAEKQFGKSKTAGNKWAIFGI